MNDFRALRVRFTTAKGTASIHTVFCKKHSVRQGSETTPNRLTLFTVGWPPYCDEEGVRDLYSRVGDVASVYLQARPGPVAASATGTPPEQGNTTSHRLTSAEPGQAQEAARTKLKSKRENPLLGWNDHVTHLRRFCVGYVVFRSEKEVDAALRLCAALPASTKSKASKLKGLGGGEPLTCAMGHIRAPTGLTRWCRRYAEERVSLKLLEASVKEIVHASDLLGKEEQSRKRAQSEQDEDGWTTVTKKTRLSGGGDGKQNRRKKKKKELLNFYRFQQRETQRQKVAELRKKFEEDKRRVQTLKAKRKFKPF